MEHDIKTWLQDIVDAINEIDSFIPVKNFLEFQNDLKTKRAVERDIEIIGEAVSRIMKVDSNVPISTPRRIIDTRNRIIHGYDTVSEEIIWAIVIKDLPILKQEVEQILA